MFQLIDIKIRLPSWDNEIKLLVVKESEPLRFKNFKKTFPETSSFFLQLFITLEITIRHDKLQLILPWIKHKFTLSPGLVPTPAP